MERTVMTEENFFDTDKPMDQVTLQELDLLAQSIFHQRGVSEDLEELLKTSNKTLDRLQAQMIAILDRFGRTNYEVPGVGKLVVSERSYVGLPKTPEAKEAFYSYLKDKGIFDELISVNSNTLNSFYKREREIAREEGRALEFKIPGIGEPSTSTTLRMTKGK
jgi:hypothetical protein